MERWTYVVQFGPTNRAVPESAIQTLVTSNTPWDSLREGRFSGIDHFIFTLTQHRLKNPPARIARSFATARTLFYPHQFKPLLKFLDSPRKRLLIADDVGLGKTIEAGYILRELAAYESVERVLVVVPARLAPKWKRELETRFQEHFEIVKGRDIIRQTERIRMGREVEPFHWIISYESIRPEEVRLAIVETEFPIDVLIADEAHRMRNPETLQHKVGNALCQISADTAVFLSATPVQNKLEDLWHLFRLLSEEEFAEWPVFEEQIKANRSLLQAQRALTTTDFERAKASLQEFSNSPAGKPLRKGDFFVSVLQRLNNPTSNRRDIVELQADIGRLSPIGHIFCRTRKAEALTQKPERAANWKRVPLTAEERAVYDNVEACCRATWPGVSDSWGFQMSLLMAYRMTASCMPAAVQYFTEKLSNTEPTIWSEEIEEFDSQHNGGKASVWTTGARNSFLDLVALYQHTVQHDSKLEELLQALETIWSEDATNGRKRRKVLIFSFFRRTLEYLATQLRERKLENRMIHGGISVDAREVAIDEFLESDAVPILLTSEVGGEGLDLQRASVVVNYDLPWNPMVVEQRIGRVDRIGQQSARLVIVNLVIENSVEEYVLKRLLDKIQIFKDSVGEMDEIVGEEIESLTASALRGELSKEEIDKAIEQRGSAISRRIHEARELLTKVDGLMAADQALLDEIGAVVGERQIPGEPELLKFLNTALALKHSGSQLPSSVLGKVIEVDLKQIVPSLERHLPELGDDAQLFIRKLATGVVRLTLSREAAYSHPKAELIHLHHPLTKNALLDSLEEPNLQQTAFGMKLSTNVLPKGEYAFLMATVQIHGHRPHSKLVGVLVNRNSRQVWSDYDLVGQIVVGLLDHGQDHECRKLTAQEFDLLQNTLLEGLHETIGEIERREGKLDLARREQQQGTRRATLEFLLSRATDRVNRLIDSDAAEFAIRMAKARVAKARRELDAFAAVATPTPWLGVEHEEIAVGLLTIH
ncbi:MAG TPA: SNF2-related protein [Pyrinomonadaceae bacterium]|nr:SNF2-related protein [Pyrinomonadaceae bacterium]